jgi:histidinol phosphatase-like enzyme (inositol monophosphatase family)
MELKRELEAALELMRQVSTLALQYAAQGVASEDKADESPVTVADRECERLIVETLDRQFPADGLLGEEGANKPSRNGRRWIIDPIDGTRDFVRGNRLWASLLGLELDGQVALGVAAFPAMQETYWGVRGHGAFRDGQPIRISNITDAGRSVACINQMQNTRKKPGTDKIIDLAAKFWAVRSLGGALDAMFVCAGHAEFWLEPGAKPWDLAAPSVIAEEAGAVFMDYQGANTIYGGNAIICVPALVPLARWFLGLA